MFCTPLAYFITFTTYGTWLHGDPRTSIIRRDNGQTELLADAPSLFRHEQFRLKNRPVILDAEHRRVVREAIIELCAVRKWTLYALHVRTNHVHTILWACQPIASVTNALKQWSTRKLREQGFTAPKMWTMGGSKKYIFKPEKLREKIHYVIHGQGTMTAYYVDERFSH